MSRTVKAIFAALVAMGLGGLIGGSLYGFHQPVSATPEAAMWLLVILPICAGLFTAMVTRNE